MAADMRFDISALDRASQTFVKMAAVVEKLEKKIEALDGKKATADVDVDTRKAEKKLNDLDKSFGSTVIRVAALGRALKTIAVPTAVLSAAPAIASLGSAAVSASGSLFLLPAAGAAAGAAVGALVVGLRGFGDAMKELDDPEKFAEAIAKLSPAARSAAVAIRDLAPAWKGMQLDVQEKLFASLTGEIRTLSERYLPVLKTGLGAIATELNASAREITSWAAQASTVADVEAIFARTREAVASLVPAGQDVVAALLDIARVGSDFLPSLADGIGDAAARFREFITSARESGKLREWIQGGIDTLSQLGRIAGNVGGILGSLFAAADASGADFLTTLERATDRMDAFLASASGQAEVTGFFAQLREAAVALRPGLEALAKAAGDMLGQLADSGVLVSAAEAFSALAIEAAPLLGTLGQLASVVLPPLLRLVEALAPVLGPVAAGFLAVSAAGKGLAVLSTAMTAVATTAGTMAAQLSGSAAAKEKFAAAGTRVSGGLDRIGRTLPIVGTALVGLGMQFEAVSSGQDKATQALVAGGQAAADYTASADSLWDRLKSNTAAFVTFGLAADVKVPLDSSREAAEAFLTSLPPLEEAQARAAQAASDHVYAVQQFGANSPQAVAAADALGTAQERLKLHELAARDATDLHTAAITRQRDEATAAASAGVAYERSLLTLEGAQRRADEAARLHGAGSLQLREATVAVSEAALGAATAAGNRAVAERGAAGAANENEIRTRAEKEELGRLAAQSDGPTRLALLNLAGQNDATAQAAFNAEVRAREQKDELGRLGAQATGPLAEALATARNNFGTLGGAHATAEQRAQAQKDELLRLANMASGPLRTELLRMADQVRTLPDGDFVVKASGEITKIGPYPYNEARARAGMGLATGGILPGYTPGRDVHSYVSPTGGRLELSGGEAVMRPEFTRAVGPGWVHQMNLAARHGGVQGVASMLAGGRPARRPEKLLDRFEHHRRGGIVQRFAMGGLVRGGTQPYERLSRFAWQGDAGAVRPPLATQVIELARKLSEMAAMEAAAGGAIGGAGGPGGWQWQMSVLRQRFPGLALISGFRPGAITATGNRSYHGMGRAVDVPPRMDVFNFIRGTYGANTRELIFSPANNAQIHNGRPHMYTGITRAQHFDHVHWAYRRGGIVPKLADRGALLRSGEAALNLSGQPERVLSPAQTAIYDAVSRARGAVTTAGGDARDATLQLVIGELQNTRRELAEVVAAARPNITVNDQSGNPVETARAVMFAQRMSRLA
jgi:hypothetical protein